MFIVAAGFRLSNFALFFYSLRLRSFVCALVYVPTITRRIACLCVNLPLSKCIVYHLTLCTTKQFARCVRTNACYFTISVGKHMMKVIEIKLPGCDDCVCMCALSFAYIFQSTLFRLTNYCVEISMPAIVWPERKFILYFKPFFRFENVIFID